MTSKTPPFFGFVLAKYYYNVRASNVSCGDETLTKCVHGPRRANKGNVKRRPTFMNAQEIPPILVGNWWSPLTNDRGLIGST